MRKKGAMVRALASIALAFAFMGTIAPAHAQGQTQGQPQGQPQVQTQDKAPDLKKEDPVPPATEPNKPEQGGKQEPAAKVPGSDGNAAALSNGVLTAPGAPTDVDTAPSKVSSRTAADDQLATVGYRLKHLSAEQKTGVYAEIGKSGPTPTFQVPAAVGAEIPSDLALGGLKPLPEDVTARYPELNGMTFANLSGKLALIDPTMRIVIDVAAQ
jgi:hypothetical protein